MKIKKSLTQFEPFGSSSGAGFWSLQCQASMADSHAHVNDGLTVGIMAVLANVWHDYG